MTSEAGSLAALARSYDGAGSTLSGRSGTASTTLLGRGDDLWDQARRELLAWGVKSRSGFTVEPATDRVQPGDRYWLTARAGPVRVREPVEVVAVVDEPDRCGFAYVTLEGHPVSGEEAFVVHRDGSGGVRLTVRSVTRPGRGLWRLAFPAVLVAQRAYRRRYARALRGLSAT